MNHAVDEPCGQSGRGQAERGPGECGQGGVPEHPREPTRTGGTEPATHPTPEVVQVSAGRDGAVRPPSIPQNRPHAARADASTQSAASYEAAARSRPPTVPTSLRGSIRPPVRLRNNFEDRLHGSLYTPNSIYVSRHIKEPRQQLPIRSRLSDSISTTVRPPRQFAPPYYLNK